MKKFTAHLVWQPIYIQSINIEAIDERHAELIAKKMIDDGHVPCEPHLWEDTEEDYGVMVGSVTEEP